MASAGPIERPFVGRVAEREVLAAHVAAARAGSGRVALVSGEPGVGKTRLVEEAVAGIAADRVLWGRCQEIEGAPAFWPWIQALRAYVRATPPARLRSELGDDAARLARLVPAIRARCPDVATVGDEPLEPEAARFRLFDAVTMFLRTVTTSELAVIVLDDLHWGDSESLLLLAFVARELRDLHLLVIGTYREAELRQAAAAAQVLTDLVRASHRLPLAGLTEEEVREYVQAVSIRSSASEAEHETTDATIRAIHRATEGNAFFVAEMVQLLESEGRLGAALRVSEWLDIPHGVREVIRRRVQPLSESSRRVLAAAAVVGREFETTVLTRVVDLPAVDVLRELGAAVRLGVIRERGEQAGGFRFTHALLRDALLADLGATVRAELHRATAAALEAVHGDGPDAVLGDIAHHYFEAAPLGTLPRAIDYATRAGEHAYGRLGYEEAAGHFERAQQASRGPGITPAMRLRILLPLGRAQDAAGDDEGARATLVEAARLARDVGDARTFASAAAMAGASGAQTGTVDWMLINLLEEAVAFGGRGDERGRAVLLAQLARSLYFADAARRHACSEEAVAVARRLDDRATLRTALQARQFALWEPGEATRRQAIGTEALELATATSEPMAVAEALSWRILDHLELAEISVVHDALRRYRALAASCRLPRVRWHVTVVESALALLAGRLAEAEAMARRAVGLLAPSPRNNVAMFFGVQSFLVCEEQGRLAELEPTVTLAAERAVNLPIWRAALALLHAVLGRSDAARGVLADIGAAALGDLPRDGNLLGTYARLAEACALVESPRLAESLLPLLAPHASSVVVLATTAGCLGSAARYAGLLLHTLGQFDQASGFFETALATNERIGAMPQLAHTRRELARTLRARGSAGDRERATALERAAAESAARLGLVTLQRRLATDAIPRVAVAVAAPAAPVAARHAASLRHEGDVWTIACEGERTRVKDMKGVGYLLALLRHPGHEFHALDLGGVEHLRSGDAGEMLDGDARRAYAARLGELRDELEEAEGFHDIGRSARLREEMEMLAAELSRASGLGGRSRKAGSDAERARLNVTRAVRKVVRTIQADCPLLGRHLDRSVQTGLFCAYEPDPTFPVDWEL